MCLLWWSHHMTITLFSGPDATFRDSKSYWSTIHWWLTNVGNPARADDAGHTRSRTLRMFDSAIDGTR